MKALIDGDIIVYSVGFTVEKPVYWLSVLPDMPNFISFGSKREMYEWAEHNVGPELDFNEEDISIETIPSLEPIQNAYHIINQMITNICHSTGATEYTVYLTGDGNFREKVAVTYPYKGNRTQSRPVYYDKLRQYLIKQHNGVVVDGMEADDAMGIEQSTSDYNTVICTIDKDLDMIPGKHYNWTKEQVYDINENEAIKNFYTQLLMGDVTDNIKGIPGIGIATAKKILDGVDDPDDMAGVVYTKYVEHGLGGSRFNENTSLLWILREPMNG